MPAPDVSARIGDRRVSTSRPYSRFVQLCTLVRQFGVTTNAFADFPASS